MDETDHFGQVKVNYFVKRQRVNISGLVDMQCLVQLLSTAVVADAGCDWPWALLCPLLIR